MIRAIGRLRVCYCIVMIIILDIKKNNYIMDERTNCKYITFTGKIIPPGPLRTLSLGGGYGPHGP